MTSIINSFSKRNPHVYQQDYTPSESYTYPRAPASKWTDLMNKLPPISKKLQSAFDRELNRLSQDPVDLEKEISKEDFLQAMEFKLYSGGYSKLEQLLRCPQYMKDRGLENAKNIEEKLLYLHVGANAIDIPCHTPSNYDDSTDRSSCSCSDKEEALYKAVFQKDTFKVKSYLEQNANINYTRTIFLDGTEIKTASVFLFAVLQQDRNMVYLLMKYGADVTQPDSNGKTPLDYSIENRSYAISMLIHSKLNDSTSISD